MSASFPLCRWSRLLQITLVSCCFGHSLYAASGDDLARRATWTSPLPSETRDKLFSWLDTQDLDDATKQQLQQSWAGAETWRPDQVLEQLVTSVAAVDPRARQLHELCQQARPAYEVPPTTFQNDDSLAPWLTANLHLYFGLWLANQQLFDESWEQLNGLQATDIVDPAALLFYQGVTAHRRLEKDQCLSTLVTLLENEASLPQRYLVVARLMQADLEPLKPDSLDEISRLMDNIHVRLGHGRAGKRVREEEENVIAKLDKLIEQLEEQANAAAASAAAGGSNCAIESNGR